MYYFAPLEVALRLQRSREYITALDWFQTVYAYHLPHKERKIYARLKMEQNYTPALNRSKHWLLEGLDPHGIAVLRTSANPGSPGANPYSRFTLMSLARCFLEFADSEFTRDTSDSLARARDLYLTARSLLLDPDLDPPAPQPYKDIVLPNPFIEALRLRVEVQLAKLRQGRNIAGMKRQVEIPAPRREITELPQIGPGGQLVVPGARPYMRPTPYRFAVLMERSKQLVNIAQQIEAAFLAAMEKRDQEKYNLLQAGYGLQLAQANEELQQRRFDEAQSSTALVDKQIERAKIQRETYKKWKDDGLNSWEKILIASHLSAGLFKVAAIAASTRAQIAQIAMQTASAGFASAAATIPAGLAAAFSIESGMFSGLATAAETTGQVAMVQASQERREQEWELARSLAEKDEEIGQAQKAIAQQHENILKQEQEIGRVQTAQARAVAEFLARKFTNAELYDWMSGVLGEVYSFFLQQATATSQLAENQLAFERHEPSPGFIQADYWQPPTNAPTESRNAPDRQGLTGSARLLQDLYRLDQYAFENDKRKLNLSQTFSLSRLVPFEFAMFRETGMLPFETTITLFDEVFRATICDSSSACGFRWSRLSRHTRASGLC